MVRRTALMSTDVTPRPEADQRESDGAEGDLPRTAEGRVVQWAVGRREAATGQRRALMGATPWTSGDQTANPGPWPSSTSARRRRCPGRESNPHDREIEGF